MKRFLIVGGIDADASALEALRQFVAERDPEGILIAGGLVDPAEAETPTLSHESHLFLEKLFKTLGEINKFTAVIPGPYDTPLQDVMRIGMHAEIDFPNVHLVHATIEQKGETLVTGIGGRLIPNGEHHPGGFTQAMAEYYLRELWNNPTPQKIILLPEPPTGKLGGDRGNPITGFLLDSFHPTVCVVGGDSEHRGIDRVAHTLIVNPGRLSKGHAAWLDFRKHADERVTMLSASVDCAPSKA